jgi:predicted nucleic acid-binding protein
MIIVDTNVVSEIMKPNPNPAVVAWITANRDELVMTSVTTAELAEGVERMPAGRRQIALRNWAERLISDYQNRVLPFSVDEAWAFARLATIRQKLGQPVSDSDTMIAAIASTHNAAVATRNITDFEHEDIELINPFDPPNT